MSKEAIADAKERFDRFEECLRAHFNSEFHKRMYSPDKISLEDFGIFEVGRGSDGKGEEDE